ncbi:MAG: hypothetical protein EOM52_01630 [Clostridia bacterium]|nr:hypothetical protein [Clostridia bacterium]
MKKILLLCTALLLLAGCSVPSGAESNVPSISPEAPSVQPAPSEEISDEPVASAPPPAATPLPSVTPPSATDIPAQWDGSLETLTLADFPVSLSTGDEVAAGGQPLYLVAELTGQQTWLYGLPGGHGLILRLGDAWQYFDLSYLTSPRMIMPWIASGDYDGDLELELALVIYAESGTGVSVFDLHIIELPADSAWTDNWFNPEDYQAILGAALTSSHDAAQNLLTISAGDSRLSVNLTAVGYPEPGTPIVAFAAPIVSFACSGDAITVLFDVNVASPAIGPAGFPAARLTADVVYTGSTFGLSNFNIIPIS